MSNTTILKPEVTTQPKYDLDADLYYFIDNQDELVKLYDGRVLVIVNQHVEGAYDTVGEAYTAGIDTFGRGRFSIRKCMPGPEAYTVRMPRTSLSGGRPVRS